MANKLLKAKEVAERLNISHSSRAFILMKNGDIPTVPFGSCCTRVRPEDLEEFIEKNAVGETKNLLAVRATSKPEQVTSLFIGDHYV